jgi:D-beta-D-heptose 7-phosphate kinase/D-beta-D-heptose 1-phosphate adenosyltransferase
MSGNAENLIPLLAGWKPFRVLVVGDFMLDQAQHGAAERLSPDAPVPVLLSRGGTDLEQTAGGSSNVALCAAALGGTVQCFGVTGKDAEAATLRRLLAEGGCVAEGLVEDAGRPTTVKRSIVGLAQHRHPQKMFRVDIESRDPIDPAIESRLLQMIDAAAAGCDVICLEDYAKGVCTPTLCQGVIALGRKHGKPVLVDPAAIADYTRYAGATAITPNRTEACLASGRKPMAEFVPTELQAMARALRERFNLHAVVLTLDRHGAFLERAGAEPVHVPTVARRVYDVTGAGDMVLAALAAALANGFPWPEAVALSNVAAGLEVEVFGARPIPFAQVRRQALAQAGHMTGKIRGREALQVELEARRALGQRVVLTNGCFDILHAGHVCSLREARELGDALVVAVNTDRSVRSLKGDDRPVFPLEQRMEVLAALECVDLVTWFDERGAHEVIRAVRPTIYAKGGDYRRPEDVAEHALIQELGIDLRLLAHIPGVSTTQAIHKVRGSETGTVRG